MYIIDKAKNRIEKIEETTFKQLGFKERENLQEWIAHNPSVLNEDLLVIQKEFDGFKDTYERLDLLALDKQGNLVIIENKLDDAGKDVTWQVLKYASYCSTLNSNEIINIFQEYLIKIGSQEKAEKELEDFFESEDYRERLNSGNSQRVMMIAGEFRKEVTSTVLWLMNYGLRIHCFKATPFRLDNQLFLNIEQIIPMPDAEDFVISMANKTRDSIETQEAMKGRYVIRKRFWAAMLKEMNKVCPLFQNVNPTKDNWLSAGSGVSGVTYTCVITKDFIRVDLSITGRSQDENKFIFDKLLMNKSKIESDFGNPLEWERMDDNKASRIQYQKNGVGVFNEEEWPEMISFAIKNIPKMENAFKKPLQEINRDLKGQ